MIALSCGIHEASRAMPCPICPRVLAELRAEDVGALQSFAPIGKGKHRRTSAQTKAECIKLAQAGKTSREIGDALGLSPATVQTYAAGHLKPHGGARRIDHDEVIRRAKAGQYAAEIAKALGISDTTAQKIGRGHFIPRAVPRGRHPNATVTPDKVPKLRALLKRGSSMADAARIIGVSWGAVQRWRAANMPETSAAARAAAEREERRERVDSGIRRGWGTKTIASRCRVGAKYVSARRTALRQEAA